MTRSIFGFGSLVNLTSIATEVIAVEPSRISGYRRGWCQPYSARGHSLVSLGLERGNGSDYVEGVTLTVPADSMRYFEAREAGYRHVTVHAEHSDGRVQPAVSFETHKLAPEDACIPVSYLATVVVGFTAVFGEHEGLRRFVANTDGWHRPVLYDVDDPIYSRRPDGLREIADALRPELEAITTILEA